MSFMIPLLTIGNVTNNTVIESISTTYQYTIKLKDSEIKDYRLEQEVFLVDKLSTTMNHSVFNKTGAYFVINSNTLFNTNVLKTEIENKGMKVISITIKSNTNINQNE